MSEQSAIGDGGPATLLDLYDQALPRVYGYLLARCNDVSTAEELTSETFMAAAAACREPAGAASAEVGIPRLSTPWLIGVARHKLIDHWRRREREERRLRVVAAGEPESHDPLASKLDELLARQTLAQLSANHRTALTLRYVDDLAVTEVARILGRSEHSTESLLARARNAFRNAYLAVEPDDD